MGKDTHDEDTRGLLIRLEHLAATLTIYTELGADEPGLRWHVIRQGRNTIDALHTYCTKLEQPTEERP